MTKDRAKVPRSARTNPAPGAPARGKRAFFAGFLALLLSGGPWVPTLAAVSDDRGLYEQAILATQDRDYAGARADLEKLLEENSDYLPARILLGEVLLALGDAQGAEAQLLQALNAGGDPGLIVVALGQAEMLQDKTDELLNDVNTQADNPALQADVANLRGYAFLERGRLTEARAAFQQAAALGLANPTPLVGLARAALVENDPATAGKYADQAFQAGVNGAVWRLRGDIAAYSGNDAAAIEAYGHAIDLAWGDLDARTARASLLVGLGRLDEATADIAAVRQIIPDDLEAVYLSAVILARQGKVTDAMAVLTRAKRSLERILPATMDNNRTTLRMAGLICYALGDFSDAATHFERLVSISPSDDSAASLLARTRIQLGEYATAIRNLETALTINGDNPETQGLMGLVYMLRGELGDAQQYLSASAASGDVPGSLLRKGIGLLRMQRSDDAMQAFAQARQRETADSLASTLLTAIGAMEQQDFTTAADWAEKATAIAPQSAYVRHIAALALINDGRTADARAELETALKIDRTYVPAIVEMARLSTKAGDRDAARTAYRNALGLDRGNATATLELADLERIDGQPEKAEDLLRTARDDNPNLESVWTHSLEFYAAKGDIDTVLSLGQDFIRRNPNAIAIRDRLAVLLWRANRLDETVAQYQALMEISLDRGAILYRIGLVQEDRKDYAQAIEAFRRALGWLPDNNTIWRKVIILEGRTGDVAEATRLLNEYRARKAATNVDELTGQLYLAAGDYQKSLAAFQAAQLSAPASAAITIGLFDSLRGLGQQDAALAHLAEWIGTHKDDAIQTRLALAYADAGRLDEAISLQEDTLSRHAESVPILNNLALLYMQAGKTDMAADFAARARALAPDLPAVLDTVGWIMVNAGQPTDGLAVLREAQARAGGNARVHYHTAVALQRLDRPSEAREELKAALDEGDTFPERADAEKLLADISAN
jgi:putative PEP-CTERM system TPR-repeat lipoprotein